MSVKIRLKRMGSKKRPFYRIIATDSRNARDGRFIETLGFYNPITEPPDISVKEELVFKWMRNGAIPTDSAASLLRKFGTMKKWYLLEQGVAESDLDAKAAELKAKETPAMTAAERKHKVDASKAAEAEEKATAEAEEKATAEAEKKATAEAAAESEEAPEAPVTEADDDAGEASDKKE